MELGLTEVVNCTDGSDDSASSNCPYPYTGAYTVGTEIQTETFDVTFSVNTANYYCW